MANGFLQRFPDLTPLLQEGAVVETRMNGLLGVLDSMSHESEASPIATVAAAVGNLRNTLNIDVSGLSTRLPSTIQVIRNALPADTLKYVESIEDAYSSVQDFLKNSALAKEVAEGSSPQESALAVIEDVLNLFDSRLIHLTDNLIDAATLERIRTAFTAVEGFQSDFPTHRDEFLPFITENLVGVSPNLLRDPLDHLHASYAVLAPLEPEALTAALGSARQTLYTAFNALFTAINSLDPADANGYVQIQNHLNEVEAAIGSLSGALAPLYQQLQDVIESHAWDAIFSMYRTFLEAITIETTFSIDAVVDEIVGALENILTRFDMIFGVEDLTERIKGLNQIIRDTFVTSPLGQIRQTLLEFLEQIRQAIENVPMQEIQKTVENMLNRVKQELEALNITRIRDDIEKTFQDVENVVAENVNQALVNQVQAAIAQVLNEVQTLSIADLTHQMTNAVDQLESVITDLETALDGSMNDLTNLVSALDQLSFNPLSDEVIEEIDELKGRLQSINPRALSDVEKIAIKGALAVLEAIDLESQVINGLKTGFDGVPGFDDVENQIKSLLSELTAALDRVRDRLDFFNPEKILGPVFSLLDQASDVVEQLNGKVLLNPLYAQVDQCIKDLEAISPGQLLDPLQAPYNSMIQVVQRLNPDQWVAPLKSLYEQIDQLIAVVDITPVFDELDRRQKELFHNIQTTILNALDNLNLPEPLSSFFEQLRPVLEGMTEAIFGDPDTELKKISVDLKTQCQLNSLFEPLDKVFNQLAAMIESVPQEALSETMNTIRETIGVGLAILEPRAIINHFRNGQSRLAELAPTTLLAMPLKLPGLKLSFQVRTEGAPSERQGDVSAVLARFDAVFALTDPERTESRIHPLIQTHNDLLNALRLKINDLDPSGAEEVYDSLRASLDRLLPDFLRSPEPLTYADIMAGVYAMRPSAKAVKVEHVLERFLQKIQPLEDTLGPAMNGYFSNIREIMLLINPLSLKEAVEEIYATIREKARILEPDALADSIRSNVFDPLTDPLKAIDPTEIKRNVNEVFNTLLNVISGNVKGVLDDIAEVLDQQLRAIRAEIRSLLEQIKEAMNMVFEKLKHVLDQVEGFVFVDLLERLNRIIDNLGMSFDKELDRVSNAFNNMLAAIPV